MTALRKIRTELTFAREPIDSAREFSIHQHDPLVAFADFGKERLNHVRLGPGLVEDLRERRKIGAILVDPEDRLAAIAMQRLDHNRAMSALEIAQVIEMSRDEGGRHEAGVIEHEHLLGCIHHFARVVDH